MFSGELQPPTPKPPGSGLYQYIKDHISPFISMSTGRSIDCFWEEIQDPSVALIFGIGEMEPVFHMTAILPEIFNFCFTRTIYDFCYIHICLGRKKVSRLKICSYPNKVNLAAYFHLFDV